MRVLVVEPYSGISGDMFVAAAAKLAGCEDEVAGLPGKLGLAGITCEFRDVVRASLRSRKFDVMAGLRPAEDATSRDEYSHHHGHHNGVSAQDHHQDGDLHHHHESRSLTMIREMVAAAGLEPRVVERALRMFDRLGEVEAEIHGIPLGQVHFHEVGAVDSLVDIVGAALCIERLGVGAAYSTPVCVGSGTLRTAHGILPVPAPATERLLQGMPTTTGELPGEWTTPTGALILGELNVRFDLPTIVTSASAFGAGGRDLVRRPNVLRLRLAETTACAEDGFERDEVVVIRCNIDDSTGELLGADFVDALLKAGARDVTLQSAIMKKGRPGQVLEVLSDPERAEALATFLLTRTSSIGVRMNRWRRVKLPREACIVQTPFGDVSAKMVRSPDGRQRIAPEYESCHIRAGESGVSVNEVYRAALIGATRGSK